MARFVPPLDPSTLTNSGERAVAVALAGLPDHYTVYHGYLFVERSRSRTGREYYREGEIDFVVFDRRRGLIVLAVKGGTIEYDPGRGYRRRETGEPVRPFEQARDNMHALMGRIAEQPEFRGQGLPFVRGYAVVFPHCNWTGHLAEADRHDPPGGRLRPLASRRVHPAGDAPPGAAGDAGLPVPPVEGGGRGRPLEGVGRRAVRAG